MAQGHTFFVEAGYSSFTDAGVEEDVYEEIAVHATFLEGTPLAILPQVGSILPPPSEMGMKERPRSTSGAGEHVLPIHFTCDVLPPTPATALVFL